MAERILRSPGVSTRELDLSAPGRVRPQGIPAGIIGTAEKGPAFVPVTFATLNDFTNLFGATEGKHFGAMAVAEWMRNARSGLFLRVLGVGDGNKAATTGVTTNAGFIVGEDMRDKDRTTGSGYASFETDGAADTPKKNPYAHSGTADVMTLTTEQAGRVSKAAVAEVFLIAIGDGPSGNVVSDTLDGTYIVVYSHAATKNFVFWLDGQGSTRSVGSGNGKIMDGSNELEDLSAYTTIDADITIVNVSGNMTRIQAATNLTTAIDAEAGISAVRGGGGNDHKITVTQGTAAAHSYTQVTNVTSAQSFTKAEATPAAGEGLITAITSGVTVDAGQPKIFKIAFSDTAKPQDHATIKIVGCDGSASLGIQFNSGNTDVDVVSATEEAGINTASHAAGNATAQAVDTALTNLAQSAAYLSAGGATTYVTSGTDLTITFPAPDGDAGEVLPTITVDNNNAPAPTGKTYFLGCKMYNNNDNTREAQDYLGSATNANNTTGVPILRGVLMFPSGVVPGITTTEVTSMPTGAFAHGADGYGTGKNSGSSTGIGKIDPSTGTFKIVLNGYNNSNYSAFLTGSFNPLDPIYFPKVMNTDPTKIQEKGHYLYAHYDVPVGLAEFATGNTAAFLLDGAFTRTDHSSGFTNGSKYQPTFEDFRMKFAHAFTPWIMSQRLGNAAKKLFRFHMLDAGSAGHANVKISVANIQKSTDTSSDYGSFDIQIRAAHDTDTAPVVLQTFSRLSLNPSSDRYIARVIGDQNTFFEFEKNDGKQKLVTEGLYPNQSQYVRVEVVDQIEAGLMEATALPIGFAGKHHLVIDGHALRDDDSTGSGTFLSPTEPPLPFRQSVSIGTKDTKVVDSRFYWGVQYQDIRDTTARNQRTKVISLVDNLTKWYPAVGGKPSWVGDNAGTQNTTNGCVLDADEYNNNEFSLENLWIKTKKNSSNAVDLALAVDPTKWHEAVYIRDKNTLGATYDGSGVYHYEADDTTTKTAATGYRYLDVSKDFASTASKKYYKFTVPMQGGFDGLDILDQDKAELSNLSSFREMDSAGSPSYGGPNGPTTAAFRKAIDILAEKSDVDIQLLATPGMRMPGITDYALDKTEERFDALYIMDMPAYDHDNNLVVKTSQETSVSNTAQNLADRNLDTSFAATYFPDLVVADGDVNVVAPPSVAVLGAFSLNDSVAHPWYAPAGFARGALASTIETAVKLNRSNMDVLYDSDINPITSFPQSGDSVVVFGQKTMLQAQSALDRVNVRRLLIDIRRKVRAVGNQILFEPNRPAVLGRFSALVNPILGRIQQQQGLDRFKVVIDTTTTTQQDVENNTVRGKIFLQPTRSIEFISLDFVVTNAGAEL